MLRRKSSELNFVRSREPKPTVEVNRDLLDAMEPETSSYQIAQPALAACAKNHPDLVATVYTYETMSVNFHKPCWSEFLIVAGPQVALDALHQAYSAKPGLQVRYSDAIPPSEGIRAYHLEGGRLWEIEEEGMWFSKSTEEIAADAEELIRLRQSWAQQSLPAEEEVFELTATDPVSASVAEFEKESESEAQADIESHALRYRRARASASVGAIRRSIERVFGLPEGSVALCGPDRQPLRADARIATLRKRWNYDLADE